MKIIFITLDFPPENFGGTGIYASDTVKLLSQKHEVHVLTTGKKGETVQLNSSLYIHKLPCSYLPFLRLPSFLFQLFINIKKVINKYGINVIHSNDVEGCFFLKKLPSVVTIHHISIHNFSKFSFSRNIKNLPYVFMEMIAIKRASHVIAVGHTTESEIVKKYHNAKQKISIVYPPHKESKYDHLNKEEIRNRYGVSQGKILILAPGVMREERKGGLFLVEALKKIKNTNGFVCVFTGASREGGWGERLKKHAASFLGTIKYVGNLENEKFQALMSVSDIVVYPSIFEGFGLPVVEAMSMKKPVIATKTGEAPYIINHGVDGYLINLRDSGEIYKYLKVLIGQESTRIKMGNEAYCNISNKINNHQILDSLDNIYKSAIAIK
jgi:glycosyltransferase involved in cell wall biosynthesis